MSSRLVTGPQRNGFAPGPLRFRPIFSRNPRAQQDENSRTPSYALGPGKHTSMLLSGRIAGGYVVEVSLVLDWHWSPTRQTRVLLDSRALKQHIHPRCGRKPFRWRFVSRSH